MIGASSTSGNATALGIKTPMPIRCALMAARVVDRCGLGRVDLSKERLLADAQRTTGLSDFGPEEFRVPLQHLLKDYQENQTRGFAGRLANRKFASNVLCNRLWIQDDLKRHPETTSLKIEQPLFILGFPRTGTSALHNFLAQDPANRFPYLWETRRPALPAGRKAVSPEARIRHIKRLIKVADYLAPQIRTLHPVSADGPEECTPLLANSLISPAFTFSGENYRNWLWNSPDDVFVNAYRYYRSQLQILQRRDARERWALKSPAHMFAIDSLLKVFPDACIIQTHRDPTKVVASGCSLVYFLERLMGINTDVSSVAERYFLLADALLERSMAARDVIDSARVYDMQFNDLMKDPVGEIRRAYEYFSLPFTPELERGIQNWLAQNPREKHGKHQYTLEQFGLTREDVDRKFAAYRERFQVPQEKAS